MWGLPENASVSNLSLSGELSSSIDYLDRIKRSMHEVGGVPEIALSSNVNNRETGASVSMRYMPMLEARQVKIQTYGAGLRLVNRLIMKMTAIADVDFSRAFEGLDASNKYRNEVVFPSPLPRDESIELDRATTRIDAGLTSRRYEMQKMGFSQREIEKIREDIEDEREEQAELEFMIGQKFVDDAELDEDVEKSAEEIAEKVMGDSSSGKGKGNPNPVRPDPDVQSMKVSSNAVSEMNDG